MNVTLLKGRLTADPILRYTNTNQIPVATFAIAVPRRLIKDRPQETDFFQIVAWQGTGEFVCRNFVKGQPIIVEGRLQQRSYTDPKTNETRQVVEVVAETVDFAGHMLNDPRNNAAINDANFDPHADQVAA